MTASYDYHIGVDYHKSYKPGAERHSVTEAEAIGIRSRIGEWFRAEGQRSNLSSGSKRFGRSAPMPVRTKRNSRKSRQMAVFCPLCSFIGE